MGRWCEDKRKLVYLDRGEGSCGPANRDVVKLEVYFHCKKKPPCFPFPAKTYQRYVKHVTVARLTEQFEKVWDFNT